MSDFRVRGVASTNTMWSQIRNRRQRSGERRKPELSATCRGKHRKKEAWFDMVHTDYGVVLDLPFKFERRLAQLDFVLMILIFAYILDKLWVIIRHFLMVNQCSPHGRFGAVFPCNMKTRSARQTWLARLAITIGFILALTGLNFRMYAQRYATWLPDQKLEQGTREWYVYKKYTSSI